MMIEHKSIQPPVSFHSSRHSRVGGLLTRGLGGVVVLFSFMLPFGCSASPDPAPPQPTTQEIRSDADRLFEKLDQEKLRKSETEP